METAIVIIFAIGWFLMELTDAWSNYPVWCRIPCLQRFRDQKRWLNYLLRLAYGLSSSPWAISSAKLSGRDIGSFTNV